MQLEAQADITFLATKQWFLPVVAIMRFVLAAATNAPQTKILAVEATRTNVVHYDSSPQFKLFGVATHPCLPPGVGWGDLILHGYLNIFRLVVD